MIPLTHEESAMAQEDIASLFNMGTFLFSLFLNRVLIFQLIFRPTIIPSTKFPIVD